MPNLLKVRLSLKGRPIRTYTFNKKSVTIGRDPGSDIFLDNTGISRNHARIERTPGGYMVEDLGSANGTYLNEKQINRDYIGHDDVVQIGKFALWMGVESDRRDSDLLGAGSATPGAFEGTTVLSPSQLMEMQKKARDDEPEGAAEPVAPAIPSPKGDDWKVSRAGLVTAAGAAFLLGVFFGVAGTFLFLG